MLIWKLHPIPIRLADEKTILERGRQFTAGNILIVATQQANAERQEVGPPQQRPDLPFHHGCTSPDRLPLDCGRIP